MKCCGRFEDTHGFFSIMMKVRDESYPLLNERTVVLKDDTLIQRGLCSSRVFQVTENDIFTMASLGIDTIVFFFDVDSLHSSRTECLTVDEFLYGHSMRKAGALKSYELLMRKGFNAYYRPIVWAAETFIVQQFCKDGLDALEVYLNKDPLYFHQKIASILSSDMMPEGCNKSREIKRTYHYILKDRLIKSLAALTVNSYNYDTARWLISGCSFDNSDSFLSLQETEKYISGLDSLKASLSSIQSFYLNGNCILTGDRDLEDVILDFKSFKITKEV